MYVRFVIDEIDPHSSVERGIVQPIFRLWRSGALSAHEEAWWAELRAWLNVDLDEPDHLARSRRRGASAVAISWFKASATGHIARARECQSRAHVGIARYGRAPHCCSVVVEKLRQARRRPCTQPSRSQTSRD